MVTKVWDRLFAGDAKDAERLAAGNPLGITAVVTSLKGGRALAQKLTPEQRCEIARRASLARWAKEKKREQ